MNFPADYRIKSIFSYIQIIIHLEAKPKPGRVTKIGGKTKRRIRGYTPLPMNYFIDSTRRNPETLTKLILAYLHRLQEFFKQYFSRMNWGYFPHIFTSMIINNFHLIRVSIPPFKTNSPLIIYTDTILLFSFSR